MVKTFARATYSEFMSKVLDSLIEHSAPFVKLCETVKELAKAIEQLSSTIARHAEVINVLAKNQQEIANAIDSRSNDVQRPQKVIEKPN
jgi:methyl-accepting chemotaxis protein